MSEIEVRGLTKRFGPVVAVDGLTFALPGGRVTGFIGANGAGKTTTLRMLLGLVRPTSGEALIGGVPYADLPSPGRVVGAVLEASAFHPGRRAVDHLRVVASSLGIERPKVAAGDALERVGLADAGRRRVGGFSLGMRQRLALAAALVGSPSVLLLDEPTNGLDPGGVSWLRGLVRAEAARGTTVLVSSHVLAEMAQTVDDVVIIDHGRLVAHASVSELAGASTLEDAFFRMTGR